MEINYKFYSWVTDNCYKGRGFTTSDLAQPIYLHDYTYIITHTLIFHNRSRDISDL